jgi:hypothetical protein
MLMKFGYNGKSVGDGVGVGVAVDVGAPGQGVHPPPLVFSTVFVPF